jgi:uncharacterized membrane protein HdeD (DUF308 family)
MGVPEIMNQVDREIAQLQAATRTENVVVSGPFWRKYKELLIIFLALLSVIGGLVLLLTLWKENDLSYYWFGTIVGIFLLSAGLTVMWTKSRFSRNIDR